MTNFDDFNVSPSDNSRGCTASQIYSLASRVRWKFFQEASRSDRLLRQMVAHANMLDALMKTLAVIQQSRNSRSASSDDETSEDGVSDRSDDSGDEEVEEGIVSIKPEIECVTSRKLDSYTRNSLSLPHSALSTFVNKGRKAARSDHRPCGIWPLVSRIYQTGVRRCRLTL